MDKELQELIQKIKATESNLAELKNQLRNYNTSDSKHWLEAFDELHTEDIEKIKLKLKEKERLLQKAQEFSEVGWWAYYYKKSELKWSEETYKIFDYPDDFEGSLREYYLSCLDRKTFEDLPNEFWKFDTSKQKVVLNQIIHTPRKKTKLVSFTSTPIKDENNEIIGVKGFVKDLTDQLTGKKGLDNFFNLSYDLHCIVHSSKRFIKVSPAWTRLLGYTEEELLSQSYLAFVHPDDLEKTNLSLDKLNEISRGATFENRYISKSGKVVHLSWNSYHDKETQLAYATARDVTKSKLAQDEILSDLSAKELLLREIHHRVKNNLQIISSLLSLQAGANGEHIQLTELYEASQNRINAMAAIHEMFYQSEELDKIEFGKYLDKLVDDLVTSFHSENKKIDINIDSDIVYVNLDTAIPLGLLINELVTNSMKHGGDKHENVEVFIKMKSLKDDQLEITIGDNGTKGLANILNQNVESLGILLINSLVEQIDGEIKQLEDCEGTVFSLKFVNKMIFRL